MENRRNVYRMGPTFDGSNKGLTPSTWLAQYQWHAEWMGWTIREMMNAIGMHLTGDAARWYSSTIVDVHGLGTVSWEHFKDAFEARYCHKTHSPLIKWIEFKLSGSSDVHSYYTEKTHLGSQAKMSTENQIDGLTYGLPARYQAAMATVGTITTTTQWLMVVQKLEAVFKKDNVVTTVRKDTRPRQENWNTGNRPPPEACKICAKIGKANQMHWHKDCPNRVVRRVTAAEAAEEELALQGTDRQGNVEGSLDD